MDTCDLIRYGRVICLYTYFVYVGMDQYHMIFDLVMGG